MVERSISGEHLITELDCLAAERAVIQAVLRCEHGPELACSAAASDEETSAFWWGKSGLRHGGILVDPEGVERIDDRWRQLDRRVQCPG
ncbi:MAG: transposase [Mycobacterium sp.]|nr:transposase [Mycobacterium sp.]